MKKIFFSILFVFGALCTYAGPYYCGVNQLHDLFKAIEGQAGVDIDGDKFVNNNGGYNTDAPGVWSDLPGVSWKVDGTYGTLFDEDLVCLEYVDKDGKRNYYAIRSIDWSNKGYVQSPGTDIVLEQPADFTNTDKADRNELRWLTSVNFSGNEFHSIKILGSNLLTQLISINLSNIPALEKLEIKECPNAVVDLTNSKFSFSRLFDLTEKIDGVANVLKGNQGEIEVAFSKDAVDFTEEYQFPRNATRYAFTTLEGTAITPKTDNGQGLFSFGNEYEGKTIKCIMKNAYFPEFEADGLVYLITLTTDMEALKSVVIAPAIPTVYQNEPFNFKASTLNYKNEPATGSVTAKWEVVTGAGTFSDATAFATAFTPSTSGNVEIKCVVTQKRAGKDDVTAEKILSFNVNPARIVTDIDVQFKFGVYLTNEEAPFTIKVTDQYGVHDGMTDGVQFLTSIGTVNPANKTFICSKAGYPSITFKAGGYEKTIDLIVIENEPLDGWDTEASSEKGETTDSFGQVSRNFAEDVIDSNRSTRWCASQYPDESGNSTLNQNDLDIPEYIIVDLGQVADICMIEVDWEVSRAAVWDLLVSEDGEKWESFGSDDPVNMGENHYISRILGQAKARYIKLDCLSRTSAQWNYSVWEIVAYAGQLPSATKKIVNQSLAYYNGEQLIIKGEGKVSTAIYSVTGQKVLSSSASAINVSSLNKGIYVARIINEDGKVSTLKFIK